MASAEVDKPQAPEAINSPATTQLRISSGNGPVTRTVLKTPLRDALPSEIPIIDVGGIFSDSQDARKAVARQIRDAATNNGFFYIANHGVPDAIPDAARAQVVAFMQQGSEVKERAHIRRSRYFNGYKPAGSQRINPFEAVDLRETFSSTYDPRHDPRHNNNNNNPADGEEEGVVGEKEEIPAEIARFLRCEDFHWDATANLPGFKDAVVAYWRACLGLARALVRSFALSLDLEEDYFAEKVTYPDAGLALNYYPPLSSSPSLPSSTSGAVAAGKEEEEEEEEVSIGSHTDFQLFTILWQDDRGGLEVLSRSGQWLNARPVRGTFVVNIADYLQRITNDRYASTVHRARNRSGRERVSMPFFFGFNLNESCAVLDCCVAEGEVKKYDEISCEEWVQRRARAMHVKKE